MGPRNPSAIYPFNLRDLADTAWAPPNLPLFPGAPAPAGVPAAFSAPTAGTPPWLRLPHEIQQAALSLNPTGPAASGDTAANPWTSEWSATPPISAVAPPYAASATSNTYSDSAASAGELDPARTQRLLAEAKRAYDFAAWISGRPSARSAQPMGYAAAAINAPRLGMPSAGSDERFDSAVGTQPPQYQSGSATNSRFARSSDWPSPSASNDVASPPIVVAANDQAPSIWGPKGGPINPFPNSQLWPGSPAAMEGARNFADNIHNLIDAWGKLFNLTNEEKEACYEQFEYDQRQCYKNHSYNSYALSGCLGRAETIRDQCLRDLKEVRPWTDVDTDGVEIPKRSKKK